MKRIRDDDDADYKPRARPKRPRSVPSREPNEADTNPIVAPWCGERIERPPLSQGQGDIFHYFHHPDLPDEIRGEIRSQCTPATLCLLMLTCKREKRMLKRRWKGTLLKYLVFEPEFHSLFQWLLQGRAYREIDAPVRKEWLLSQPPGSKEPPHHGLALRELLHRALFFGHNHLVRWMKRPLYGNPLRYHSCITCAMIIIRCRNKRLAPLFCHSIRDMVDDAMRYGRHLTRTPNLQYMQIPMYSLQDWSDSEVIEFALGTDPRLQLGEYWDWDALRRTTFF